MRGLYRGLHNFLFDWRYCRHILAVLQPTMEYGCEAWNTNKCQAKALESVQLHDCKYILGCFVANCNDPVCASLGLNSPKNRRDFHKPKFFAPRFFTMIIVLWVDLDPNERMVYTVNESGLYDCKLARTKLAYASS